jgi:aspartate aminotransferase
MTVNTNGSLEVASHIAGLERSSIRYMFDKAAQSERDDLVHLEIGEPDFDTPDHIVEAATDAASNGATHYTSNAGIEPLREAIAEKTATDNGVEYDPQREIVVTVGAMEALHLALVAITERDEEILIPTPSWPNYLTQAVLAGGVPVEVPLDTDGGFQLDTEAICEAITSKTAAVILSSPSNPTGQVLDPEDVNRVADTAAANGAFVIADEVYEGLVYEGSNDGIASVVDDRDVVLTVSSVSKKYAMTGWRLGWLAGPEHVLSEVTKIHESTTACAPTPSQHAALEAITGPQEPANEMKAAFRERRDYVYDRISAIEELTCPKPTGAFYAFVDVRSVTDDSLEFAEALLDEQGVVVAPGSGFGESGEGFVRLSFATGLDELERGLDRIEAMMEGSR